MKDLLNLLAAWKGDNKDRNWLIQYAPSYIAIALRRDRLPQYMEFSNSIYADPNMEQKLIERVKERLLVV